MARERIPRPQRDGKDQKDGARESRREGAERRSHGGGGDANGRTGTLLPFIAFRYEEIGSLRALVVGFHYFHDIKVALQIQSSELT